MHHAAPYVRMPTSTAMTNFGRLLRSLLLAVLVLFAEKTTADFTNSFDGVKAGSTLLLTWDNVPAQYYPLCITAQLIDKGADGRTATAYKANVTSMLCLPGGGVADGSGPPLSKRKLWPEQGRTCADGYA